jgi:hypothetical protein
MKYILLCRFFLSIAAISTCISNLAADEWFDEFYPYRVPILVDVPAPGEYRLELAPETITAWINEKADFPFDARYFDFDGVRLVEVDGHGNRLENSTEAGYRIWLGGELIVNGGFEAEEDGKPVGWQLSHEAFRREKASHDGSWCMTVTGADRNGCAQNVPTERNQWYRFSCRLNGPAAVNAHFSPKGGWWRVLPHSYCDPYVPESGWYERTVFFHTGDKSHWETDQVQVRMERYTGMTDDVSLRPCQMVFVLNAEKAGLHRYLLYYAPVEGVTPIVPSKPIDHIPQQTLTVQRAGAVESLDDELAYTLSSGDSCDLWCSSPLKKVFEHTPPPDQTRQTVHFAAARNESEAVQLVLRPKAEGTLQAVRASLTGPQGYAFPQKCFDIRLAQYVPIRKPSGAGNPSGATYRSTFTGRLPDPLPKFAPAAFRAGDPNVVLWIDVRVPAETPAGLYHGNVDLETSGGRIAIPWQLEVWGFTLPERPTCRTAFQFSRYANVHLFPFHKVDSEAEEYELSRAYIAEMARYKLSARSPQSATFWDPEKESLGKFGSEEKELGWAIDHLHVTGFGIGHVSGPQLGDETVQSAAPAAQGYNDLAAFLKRKGWLSDAYIQIDEPQPRHFRGVRNWITAFRAQPDACDIPMFAFVYDGQCYDALKDSVDILVPENNDTHNSVSPAAIARWPKGKEVWCYWTNTAHQWIDAPNIDARLWSPKTWWMGARGMATWAITLWWKESAAVEMQNPWLDPYTPWGNGVMAYFYPPSPLGAELPQTNLSIVPSLRMLLTRDGIEDYEYAIILEKLLAENDASSPGVEEGKAALARMRRQFRTPVAWSVSEVHWQQARACAARAIEQLQRAEPSR